MQLAASMITIWYHCWF